MDGRNGEAGAADEANGGNNLVAESVVQEDRSVYAYTEIETLLAISKSPVHQLALEEWERRERDLCSRVSRREKRSAALTNQIYNIVGWFAVFQGVVLTAVTQLAPATPPAFVGSIPLCGKIWFPIVLTGFATFVTIVGILHKFTSLKSLELTILTERQAQREAAKRAQNLRRKGPRNFSFLRDTSNSLTNSQPKSFWKNRIFVILSLIAFTGIFILSYFVILCDLWVIQTWDGGLHG